MIIIINSNQKEEKGLNENVSRLKNFLTAHDSVTLSSLEESKHDNQEELYIVAHGSPSQTGGLSPEELAVPIGTHIRKVHSIYKTRIKEIHLHGCNTGKSESPENSAYAEIFSIELSDYLINEESIEIYAANGMTIYFPDGTIKVIDDDEPYNLNSQAVITLSKIDASNKNAADEIKPFLADPQFIQFTAISNAVIRNLNLPLLIKEAEDESKSIEYIPKLHIIMPLSAHNLFTQKFAHNEMQESNNDELEFKAEAKIFNFNSF